MEHLEVLVRRRGHRRPDPLLHARDEGLRLLLVPRPRSELADLRVRARDRVRGGLDQHRDVERRQRAAQALDVALDDNQVGPVLRDRLDVRRIAREFGARRLLREVGLVVDGDDLLGGADREERLGRRRRQRDDPVRDRLLGRRDGRWGRYGGCRRERDEGSFEHRSSFHEGLGSGRRAARSSDSGLPSSPPSQPVGQWRVGAEASPLTAAGPSRIRTGVPSTARLF